MTLIYIGKGFIPGIPARNLTLLEVEKYGEEYLLRTGLFTKPQEEQAETVEDGETWQDQEHYESSN